jgi:threonine/homoserine efflux transporter RhtA
MATLACCLPWGIGAALGALGLSVFVARFQVELIVLSIVLLGVGLIQILRRGRSCRRHSRVEIAI